MSPPHFLHANNKTATAIKVAAIISAVAILYHQDFALIFNEAIHSELASHTLIVPFLFTYLVYRKRKILRAVIPLNPSTNTTRILTHELPGAILCLLAFTLYWQGSHTFYPLEYHLLSLPIFIASCILLLFNFKTLKTLAFPIAFLLFLTPPPIETIQGIGANLSTFTSQAATLILNLVRLPVTLTTEYGNPTLNLQTQSGPLKFTIDIACAGIYSLTGFTIFALFATYLTRGRLWKKGATFLTGFPLIYALNILRVTLVVIIGYHFGQEIAMGVFHNFSGWILIFLGTLTLLYLSEKIFKIHIFSTKSKQTKCASCTTNLKQNETFCFDCGKILKNAIINISLRDVGKITALLVCLGLLLPLNVPVFTLTKGPSELIIYSPSGEQVTTKILPEIEGYVLSFVYRDKTFESLSGQDASLLYAYAPQNKSEPTIWVSVEIANSQASLHYWEVCLVYTPQKQGRQPTVHTLNRREIQLHQNPPIIARFFSFQHINSTSAQVVLYWYENSLFDTGSAIEQKLVKTSVIAFTNIPETYPQVEASLLPFANAIINYWQPLKTWPWIILMIAAQGKTLMMVLIILLAATLTFHLFREQKQKESNYKAYSKLRLEEEKSILLAVHRANQQGKATGNAIAPSYKNLTGKTIQMNLLHKKLSQAEEARFVTRDVSSLEDEPIIVWRSRTPFPQ